MDKLLHWNHSVYVSYCIEWEKYRVSDQFLWPVSKTSSYEMKVFAVNFLSDYLKKMINHFSSQSIESNIAFVCLIYIVGFANQVADIIQKELKA